MKEAKILDYTHSGMTAGDPNRVVGYGAVVFLGTANRPARQEADPLTLKFSEQARQELLSIARSAVKAAVQGEYVQFDASDNPELQVKAGCFVTLKNKGMLRGCIGRFQSDAPLCKTVCEMAISSATRDLRFVNNPITPAEVPELDIEISVLSPMRQISDPLRDVRLGRDGIVIADQGRSGTFLPQVASETGWTLEEFLGHCARDKAGLAWDGWKSPTARIYTYTATHIAEKEGAKH